MAHTNPSDEQLEQLLTSASTIAIVGASSNPDKASYGIMKSACIGATSSYLGNQKGR
jgi:predicted CoA-binding protein